ncbi:MAG: STN and carboxypeptidase regulatory-like domain-containing protein [Bacteroidota bacterium]|jgi:hypothetical protein
MAFRTLKYIICFVLLLNTLFVTAQIPLLERSISLRINNEKVGNVLEIIAKQGNFSFSYNSDILDVNNRVDVIVSKKTVREVLNIIFDGTLSYKVRGQYIILQKNDREITAKSLTISGYIFDKQTDKHLEKVSIYDRKSLSSTITNQYGFYRIKLSVSQLPIRLTISRPGYEQQSILIKSPQSIYQDIELSPIKRETIFNPPIEDNSIEKMDLFKNQNPTPEIQPVKVTSAINDFPDITDESIFPTSPTFDSTLYESNWDMFIKRLGKIFVSRSQRINAQNVKDSLNRNFQFSILPFLGTNRLLSGSIKNDYSVNILMGYSGGVRKLEVGGLINGVRQDVEGIQLAGLGNIAGGTLSGVQASSLLNIAGHMDGGLQLSGSFNAIIKESSGWQIAPVNFAHRVLPGGKQIGFINISDSTETTPIGFLSFVGSGNGYKRLELSADENETVSFTFKTGVRKFYNVLALHYNFLRKQEVFGLGYGIGRAYELGRAWMFNTDLTANILVEYDDVSPNVATMWKLDMTFEKQIAQNIAITFGPSLKYLIIDQYNVSYWQARPFNNIPSYEPFSSNDTATFWLGFQMGIRIRSR